MTPQDVQALVDAFDASEWDEMTLVLGGETVQLGKTGRPPSRVLAQPEAPSTAPLTTAGGRPSLPPGDVRTSEPDVPSTSPAAGPTTLHRITSPSVGVLWHAPQPSAPPFVEVGQRVEPADPVCIVEVMKLFNHVQAGVRGTIRSVEVGNGEMVEHGQTLFLVELEP